uniref:Uncharacterized protein n=1 Tax=Oryza meridionalis TaxID=40149 RepID=A0A0E0EPV6_9ORYZ
MGSIVAVGGTRDHRSPTGRGRRPDGQRGWKEMVRGGMRADGRRGWKEMRNRGAARLEGEAAVDGERRYGGRQLGDARRGGAEEIVVSDGVDRRDGRRGASSRGGGEGSGESGWRKPKREREGARGKGRGRAVRGIAKRLGIWSVDFAGRFWEQS